jgi:hypothetical protein
VIAWCSLALTAAVGWGWMRRKRKDGFKPKKMRGADSEVQFAAVAAVAAVGGSRSFNEVRWKPSAGA